MKRTSFALFFTVLCGFAQSFNVEHYSASLILDFEHKSIQGSETILLRPQESALHEIELDANEIVVDSVSVGALDARCEQSASKLRIYFERTLPRKRLVTIAIKFHGSPARGLLFKNDTVYTVYNTSHWMVVNHAPADLATLHLELNVPANKLVVANGENVGSERMGDRLLSRWDEKRPIPDFVFGFAVGPFAQAGDAQLRYFSSKFDRETLAQIFRSTRSTFLLR